VERPATLAVTGASFALDLDGREMQSPVVVQSRAGAVLTFKGRHAGARAYVALDGGLDLPSVLGSVSTQTRSPFPGLAGRALRAGDEIPLHRSRMRSGQHVGGRAFTEWWTAARPEGACTLRVIPATPAPAAGAAEALCATRFIVSARSDRMGYRLEGSVAWPDLPGSLLSAATTLGAVQVPPGGEPILLMADHQTTGGYAQVAVLCRADRQVAGQLAPGDAVRFRAVSLEEARAAHAAREALLDELAPEVRA
jgi:biotin-dependent carboxylase-like uncharacterized protein